MKASPNFQTVFHNISGRFLCAEKNALWYLRLGATVSYTHLGGLNIVLDVYSGSVHVVDDASYDIIGMYESKTHDEIMTAILEKYAGDEEVSAEEIEKCFLHMPRDP